MTFFKQFFFICLFNENVLTSIDLNVLKLSLINKFGFPLLEIKRFKHNKVPAWNPLILGVRKV